MISYADRQLKRKCYMVFYTALQVKPYLAAIRRVRGPRVLFPC